MIKTHDIYDQIWSLALTENGLGQTVENFQNTGLVV